MNSNIRNSIFALLLGFVLFFSICTPVQAQESPSPEYVIQSGDTLIGIASLFGVTVDEIIELNQIEDSNQIYPGLRLKIPGYPGVTGVISPVTVEIGESWHDLLVKYKSNAEMLQKINHVLSTINLYAGAQLLIPLAPEEEFLAPVTRIDSSKTFLELASLTNTNPNTLLLINRRNSPHSFYYGDLVYSTNLETSSEMTVSTFFDNVSLNPLPLVQGTTAVIKISSNKPGIYTGTLNGQPLHFYSEDGLHYFALQGIHAMSEPGLYDLIIESDDAENEEKLFHEQIILAAGYFETDPPLTVDPALIDPVITQPELDTIKEITSVFTAEKYWRGTFISPDTDYASEIPNYDQVKEITSYFGSRRTYNDDPTITFHTGIDFGGGQTLPVVSPADGKVVFAGYLDVRGNSTIIDHGLGVFTAYYHQSEINVHVGEMVTQGQRIGKVGNTGRVDRSDEYDGAGSHLHWELWVNGVQADPLDWVNQEYP